jgi:4-aminobutyrate aminotransferase/(S)-3-amino-2-methylpropionate transaminase
MNTIRTERLAEKATVVGEHLLSNLYAFQDRFKFMSQARGQGTLIAWDMADKDLAWRFVSGMLKRGVNIGVCGEKVIRLRPSLIFEKEHADIFLEATEDTLKTLS